MIVREGCMMPARVPEDLPRLWSELFNRGDLDGVAALYEPDGRLVTEPGRVVTGQAQIREALDEFFALRGQVAITPKRVLLGPDGVALASNNWSLAGTNPDGSPVSLAGTSGEIVRRQPDGTWLIAVDDPYSQSQ
jgi:uncharacterized protein (TIGR02246 family)